MKRIVVAKIWLKKYPPKLLALAMLGLYSAAASAQASNNPYKLPWHCEAHNGQWVCREMTSDQPSMYDPSLTGSAKRQAMAKALGWIPDNSTSANCSSCGGHYYEPPIPGDKKLLPLKDSASVVSSDKGAVEIQGSSLLQGHVEIVQPGRMLYADSITLSRDPVGQQPSKIEASGNVRVRQPGILILANNGTADFNEHKAQLNDVTYLMKVNPDLTNAKKVSDVNFTGYGHGQSETIAQMDEDLYRLTKATYSTCPPTENTWQLNASRIDLNTATGRGYAYNSILDLQGFPAFYLPYFSFPLNHDRQSGFLYGSIGNSSTGGFSVTVPYYFNLAPNYDWTLTPTIFTKAGVLFDNEFRYLDRYTSATLGVDYMPNDNSDGESHHSIAFTSQTQFNRNWQLSTNYNYMSDQDFAQNFNNSTNIAAINQILYNRQATLQYNDTHWSFTGLAQQYQILGSQLLVPNEPYDRLPELDLSTQYPNLVGPFSAGFTSQYVHFTKDEIDGSPVAVDGERSTISPNVNLPLNWAWGYFTPAITLNNTYYQLNNIDADPTNTFPNSSISRSLPMFNVDSGIYFDRNFMMNGAQYTQTLSPRIYYLYVPYENQNNIPIFDTGIQSFSYNSLFSTNRFTGLDRIGDANQISGALSTSIDNAAGQNLMTAAVGQIFYFRDRQVSLCNNTPGSPPCISTENPEYNQSRSDVAGLFTYNFDQNWSFNANATYDTFANVTDMQSYVFQFKPDTKHIFNFGYQDNRYDYALLTTQQLQEGLAPPRQAMVTSSFLWNIVPQWDAMGLASYSLNDHRIVSTFGGIQYSTCCWAVSFGESRYLTASDPNNPQLIDGPPVTATMLQFELKGLGGTSAEIDQYAQQIPGYDPNSSGI